MPTSISDLAAAVRRLGCTPAEALALGVLATAAVAAVGVLWLLARPAAPPATPAPIGAEPSASGTAPPLGLSQAEVIVHVAGAVARPGVYSMPGGSRVGDAVTQAGGPLRKAVLDGLNLARPLTDGEQVVVPDRSSTAAAGPGPPAAPSTPGSPAGAAPAATVNLNTATIADLETLPGIGPVLAERIISHRDSVGGFKEVGELRDVPGIGEKTFQSLAPLVWL